MKQKTLDLIEWTICIIKESYQLNEEKASYQESERQKGRKEFLSNYYHTTLVNFAKRYLSSPVHEFNIAARIIIMEEEGKGA